MLVLFLGSNIGNFHPTAAAAFFRDVRGSLQPGDGFLLGADLVKPEAELLRAYGDPIGVTAAFNRNLLDRINRELGGDFDLRRFRHYAFYNATPGRTEMHLVSLAQQTVNIGSHRFAFAAGESIHTENSYKYSIEGFRALARSAGFKGSKVWLDRGGLFSLHGLAAA